MQWSRSELSAVSERYGLMLDGAMEQVNGVCLDEWDICLLEGSDPIEVSPEARSKLRGSLLAKDASQ